MSHFIAADNGSVTSQLSFTFSFDPALGVQQLKKTPDLPHRSLYNFYGALDDRLA